MCTKLLWTFCLKLCNEQQPQSVFKSVSFKLCFVLYSNSCVLEVQHVRIVHCQIHNKNKLGQHFTSVTTNCCSCHSLFSHAPSGPDWELGGSGKCWCPRQARASWLACNHQYLCNTIHRLNYVRNVPHLLLIILVNMCMFLTTIATYGTFKREGVGFVHPLCWWITSKWSGAK